MLSQNEVHQFGSSVTGILNHEPVSENMLRRLAGSYMKLLEDPAQNPNLFALALAYPMAHQHRAAQPEPRALQRARAVEAAHDRHLLGRARRAGRGRLERVGALVACARAAYALS